MGHNLGDYILKLVLGFDDTPYADRYSEKSPLTATVKKRRPKVMSKPQEAYGEGKSAREVAKELEDKYKIVETFYDMEEDFIVSLIEDVMADEIEEIMTMGVPSKKGISSSDTDKIEKKFRQSLTSQAYDGVIPGVPTLASQRGVSHLRQHPYAGRGSRPSFVDTGLYMRSFKAWVED